VPYRQLTHLLDSRFHALSPELQRAARWVRDHPAELGLQSMRQSAQAAGVSPATMTRLAHALGLDGFEAMRSPGKNAFMRSLTRSVPAGDAGEEEPSLHTPLALAQSANLAAVAGRNPHAALQAAAAAVLAARSVLFLGLRASFGIAYHLHYTCDWLRGGTQLATDPGGAWADRLGALTPQDLLVAVSQAPYTVQTVEAVQQARQAGVPVLALTDSPLSPLARDASQVLLFEAASPAFFHSMVGAQALAESLMSAVAEQGGDALLQRLAGRQRMLKTARVYWDKPRPGAAQKLAGQAARPATSP
jgi:DNA-binding MurR/RpiR family transcriptional regulator